MKALLILFILPLQIFAQDITGIWTGFMHTTGSQLPYELAISQDGDKLTAYSLTIFTINGVENTGIKSVKIKRKKRSLSIEDDELLYNDYAIPSKRVTLFGSLSLNLEDSVMILDGTFFTRSIDRSSYKGTIRLKKQNIASQTKLMAKLDEMKLLNTLSFMHPETPKKEREIAIATSVVREPLASNPVEKERQKSMIVKYEKDNGSKPVDFSQQKNATTNSSLPVRKILPVTVSYNIAADLAKRKTEIIRDVFFHTDSLVLSIYDNGEIDGDTVSVVLNDKIIIARKGLGSSAIQTTIYITPAMGDSLRLVMYAENLGAIPPNTGLLILQDGADRYEIRFSGDFKNNSAIILRRKQLK